MEVKIDRSRESDILCKRDREKEGERGKERVGWKIKSLRRTYTTKLWGQ